MQLRMLDESTLRSLVDMPSAIAAVRDGFMALSGGGVDVPVRTALTSSDGVTLFMPAQLHDGTALGLKVVSVRPANRDLGLPAIHAVILMMDAETGIPAAVLDAEWLTSLRTGAASGVATALLARPEASVLAVVGAGVQAFHQVEAVAAVRPIESVRIVSKGGASAGVLARRLLDDGIVAEAEAVSDAETAVRGADVVVTVTDSASPVVRADAVSPGTHVNAVGGYRTDMLELPVELMGRADLVIVDHRAAALAESGEVAAAIEAGVLQASDLVELGHVASGESPGRRSSDQVTVFKSVGNAVQDLVVARLALGRARAAKESDPDSGPEV